MPAVHGATPTVPAVHGATPTVPAVPGATPTVRAVLRTVFKWLGIISPALAGRLALRLFTTPWAHPVRPEQAAFLATARQWTLPSPSGSLACYEWPNRGPRVLVMHGWISHTGRMADIIGALRERGLQVLACDAPAHGRSAGRTLDLPRYRAAIETLLADAGPVDGLLAHSFGALTAIDWLAAGGPLSTQVRAAVLTGLPSGIEYLFNSFRAVMDLSPAVTASARRLFKARYGCEPSAYDAAGAAPRLAIPIMLAHGADDELVPLAQATALAPLLPHCEFQVFPGMKHSELLRHAASCAVLAEFLECQL